MDVRTASRGALNGCAMSASATADTTKVSASMYSRLSIGTSASTAPAASGPTMVAAEKLACIRPFAVTSWSRSTRLGIAANSAA